MRRASGACLCATRPMPGPEEGSGVLSEVSLDQATDACFRRWICITTWTHRSSDGRPPQWCESFDGCMSKLPDAPVGAATGGSRGVDAIGGRRGQWRGVRGLVSRGTVFPIRLNCCLLLFEFLQVLRSGRPVRDSLPGGIVWPCGRRRRDSPPRALYVATQDGLAAEW